METLGHHVNTSKGREILRTFGGLLTTEQIKTDTEFQVKSTKLRIPGQKDMDGRIRRPYLDMDVEVTGMVVNNEARQMLFIFRNKTVLKCVIVMNWMIMNFKI